MQRRSPQTLLARISRPAGHVRTYGEPAGAAPEDPDPDTIAEIRPPEAHARRSQLQSAIARGSTSARRVRAVAKARKSERARACDRELCAADEEAQQRPAAAAEGLRRAYFARGTAIYRAELGGLVLRATLCRSSARRRRPGLAAQDWVRRREAARFFRPPSDERPATPCLGRKEGEKGAEGEKGTQSLDACAVIRCSSIIRENSSATEERVHGVAESEKECDPIVTGETRVRVFDSPYLRRKDTAKRWQRCGAPQRGYDSTDLDKNDAGKAWGTRRSLALRCGVARPNERRRGGTHGSKEAKDVEHTRERGERPGARGPLPSINPKKSLRLAGYWHAKMAKAERSDKCASRVSQYFNRYPARWKETQVQFRSRIKCAVSFEKDRERT
ncbi:hypothetical protein DFH11DRAFT_1542954 [Phellopilus nigrolimitatus]|nr:hypothetical protein DFH11DRAFT_1542954 [Phellopilus nigrolimitatus]